MKKCCKKLIALAVCGAVACLAAVLFKTDKVQSWLYSGEHEDTTFAIIEKVRLLGDLLSWPINFVKALLP